jgi:hypothetical protein
MTWPEFLALTMGDRILMMEELNALIDRHNEEAGAVPDSDSDRR